MSRRNCLILKARMTILVPTSVRKDLKASNETNSNRGASNDDDRVALEGDTSANTSVEEQWRKQQRHSKSTGGSFPLDIKSPTTRLSRQAHGHSLLFVSGIRSPKKTIYSCVQCRKGFHITCFAAFHHPELVEEEFRNSFDTTARVAAARSRASQSKYISVNPSFTPPS